MRIIRSLSRLPASARGAALALGNFDGMHRGHRAVLAAAHAAAHQCGLRLGVLTFEPHPRQVFRPGDPPFRLMPFRAKALRLRDLGVELLFAVRFDRRFSEMGAEAFAADLLGAGLGARHVAVGEDFVFGHRRGGDVALLRRMAPQCGFEVTAVAAVGAGPAGAFKSSHARDLLREGRPADAGQILGAWWQIAGRVRRGDARGRELGYPTANIGLGDLLRPRFGVYAVRVRIESEPDWRPAVASLGVRPMFGGGLPLLEVHLFDYRGDLYGRHLCVAMVEFLRAEATFADVPALIRQMAADSVQARSVLASAAYAPDRFSDRGT